MEQAVPAPSRPTPQHCGPCAALLQQEAVSLGAQGKRKELTVPHKKRNQTRINVLAGCPVLLHCSSAPEAPEPRCQPGSGDPEPKFGETFGFALFCQGSVLFACFLPVFCSFFAAFRPILPIFCPVWPCFCLKMPVFCPFLPGFAWFARFVLFRPNSPEFVRFCLSCACAVCYSLVTTATLGYSSWGPSSTPMTSS